MIGRAPDAEAISGNDRRPDAVDPSWFGVLIPGHEHVVDLAQDEDVE